MNSKTKLPDTSHEKKLSHRYSGDKSKRFWRIVNNLQNEIDRGEIYSLGVALQNLEEFVLKRLNDVKPDSVNKK